MHAFEMLVQDYLFVDCCEGLYQCLTLHDVKDDRRSVR